MLNSINIKELQKTFKNDPQLLTEVFRILFYFHYLVLFLSIHEFTNLKINSNFYDPSYLSILFSPLLKEQSYHWLIKILFIISTFFTMIGFLTSIFKYLCFILALLVFLPMNDYSFFHHGPNVFILNFLLFSQAPIGKKLSIDNYIFKEKRFSYTSEDKLFYLKILKYFWVFIFFTSGVFKILNNNFLWLKVDIVGELLRINQNFYLISTFTSKIFFNCIGNLIIENYSLGRFLTIAALVIELIMPLCLIRKKKSLRLVLIGLFMLLSIQLLMGHPFFMYLLPNAIAVIILDNLKQEA